MTKPWEQNFDPLLAWLDDDRNRAGERYEDIRQSLIKIFSWRGCYDAEDLADETITRVTNKLPEIIESYKGDPALYFYGVAKNILWEINRREQSKASLPSTDKLEELVQEAESENLEPQLDCLEHCLQCLSITDRQLVLQYYQQEQPKIRYRKELARRLNETPNNLRVKVHRIRAVLQACIENCVKGKTGH